MTDKEKQENSPGEEDRGVRIEIHGEEPDKMEKKNEDSRGPGQNLEKEHAAEGLNGQEDAAKTDQNRNPEEEPDKAADASDAGEDTSSDSGAGTGKGFFGFKGRKEKDQRDQKIEELTDQVRRQMAEFEHGEKGCDRADSSGCGQLRARSRGHEGRERGSVPPGHAEDLQAADKGVGGTGRQDD